MNTEHALQVLPKESTAITAPMSASDIVAQVALIQDVMGKVMKENEHYGKIPGCGDKPALLKPGAEKLGMTFRLAPAFDETIVDMGKGHREYRIKCTLTTIGGNIFVGQGVGSASTMEGKWRYRTGPKTFTGKPVPKAYWDMRKENPAKAQESIGGKGFSTAKNDSGQWEIVEVGEKVEHENPADYYNTVLKMAKKRAHVDAILTATAASDIFAQDIEELAADGLINSKPPQQQQQQPRSAPPPKPQEPAQPELSPRVEEEAEAAMSRALKKHSENHDVQQGAGVVRVVTAKSGTKTNGQPWTRWGVKIDETWLNTFSRDLGEQAEALRDSPVNYSFKPSADGQSKDLVSIEAV